MNEREPELSERDRVELRAPTINDKPAMQSAMAPFQNAFFPGKLHSKRTLVAVLDGDLIGFVGWQKNRVLALYVTERLRGKRWAGSVLLGRAEAAIQEIGYDEIRVMVDADATGAHRFYQRHRYETEWDRENEDIAWMIKKVS